MSVQIKNCKPKNKLRILYTSRLNFYFSNIKRRFYVDDQFERVTSGRRVEKNLPRMRPHAHLYEYTVDEQRYTQKLR